MAHESNSVNAIVKDQIYLSNLSAAVSLEQRSKLGITHIVSVCPEYPSTGPNHLTIPVQDSEYEDILIHLPMACRFVQTALDQGGRVLVHCVMGISRSTTVVAAYLMKTRRITASAAVRLIKQRRPRVHPNYGFLKQLDAFAECAYEPSPTNPAYISWKRKHKQNVTGFLNQIADTTPVIPGQLFLSSDFPDDPQQAEFLLIDLGITHVLSISPAQISSAALTSIKKHHQINIHNYSPDELLVELPGACNFIREALDAGGQVLVHCRVESRACIVVCAHLMSARKIPPNTACSILADALPLFNRTHNFSRQLELFDTCRYSPTSDHPLVKEWAGPPKGTATSDINTSATAVNAGAAYVLSETDLDMNAFGDALAATQKAGVARL